MIPSLTYFQLLLEFVRGMYALFSTCLACILGRMSERSSCGASFGNVNISDLDLAETLDILLGALEVLNEESELLGL